jgi:hypothetical protein
LGSVHNGLRVIVKRMTTTISFVSMSDFSLHRVSTLSTNILSLLVSAFKIFCCTQTHTYYLEVIYLFFNWYQNLVHSVKIYFLSVIFLTSIFFHNVSIS